MCAIGKKFFFFISTWILAISWFTQLLPPLEFDKVIANFYLPKSDENTHHYQSVEIGMLNHQWGKECAKAGAQHTKSKGMLASVTFGNHSSGYHRDHITPEDRAENEALRLLVPVEVVFLRTKTHRWVTKVVAAKNSRVWMNFYKDWDRYLKLDQY